MSATLPTLTHTGEHPAWDAYLTSIYGQPLRNGTSDFPIDLSSFTFFYWSAPFGRRNKLHIACGAPDGCSRHSCKPLCGQIYGSVLRPLNSSRLGFFVAHALTPAPITDPSTGEQSIEVIRYHEPGESADSGVWYNGVVGSGIWLALGRVLDISCLVTPYRLPHERPASASIGHNLSCAVPRGGSFAPANMGAGAAGGDAVAEGGGQAWWESQQTKHNRTSGRPLAMSRQPEWMRRVVRELPPDVFTGRWLMAHGYDTLLRRYHLDMKKYPAAISRLEIVDARGLPPPGSADRCGFRFGINAAGRRGVGAGSFLPCKNISSNLASREACGGTHSTRHLWTGLWAPEQAAGRRESTRRRPCRCVQDEDVLNCGETDHRLAWRLLHENPNVSAIVHRAMTQCVPHLGGHQGAGNSKQVHLQTCSSWEVPAALLALSNQQES